MKIQKLEEYYRSFLREAESDEEEDGDGGDDGAVVMRTLIRKGRKGDQLAQAQVNAIYHRRGFSSPFDKKKKDEDEK